MSAERELIEYIYDSMKEIEFLNNLYLESEELSDFSTPIVKSSQLVELLLEEMLNENGFTVVRGRGVYKNDAQQLLGHGYVSPISFCARSKDSPIPEEYRKFLIIITRNRNEAVHIGKKTKAEMYDFSKAYNCFVCWFFESYDIFGEETELKIKILKMVDNIEKNMGAPIQVEYKTNTDGSTQRLLKYNELISNNSSVNSKDEECDEISKETVPSRDIDPNEGIKQFITECMGQSMAQILGAINDSSREIGEKIDNVKKILNSLIDQISSYQSLVESQMELAVTDDEIDRIIHAYSDACVNRIIEGVDKKYSNISKDEEEKELIAKLGQELWDRKLTPSSRNYLISSKVTYKYYMNIDTLDYSGVCLLVTKALEVEMSERFYKAYVAFLKRGYTDSWKRHLDDFPTTLVKTINGSRVLKSAKDFTLGSVSYVLCASNDRNATEAQLRNNERKLIEFAKDGLMQGKTDDEILTILKGFGERVADITQEYRNKAAHTNELGRVDAETCFKIVIDTEQLLKKMLDTFEY